MSETINNRQFRQELLREMIIDLHAGTNVNEVKDRFKDLLDSVGPTEIAEIEQRLIDEGMPADEIKRLCDVHTAVFRDSLQEQETGTTPSGHPVHTFEEENRALSKVIAEIEGILSKITAAAPGEDIAGLLSAWQEKHAELLEVEKHYSRKENILFPYLEKYGITGPPSVMWALHDDIRRDLKKITSLLKDTNNLADKFLTREISDLVLPTLNTMKELFFKEENILFPMCLETLSPDQWQEIGEQSGEIGYLISPAGGWSAAAKTKAGKDRSDNMLKLDTGTLSLDQINNIFKHLPVDITFVDKDDSVSYFSQGKERIFPRTPAIIGRKVQFCHPPDSVHVVNKIVDDFKNNRRDSAEFWIDLKGTFVYIRYFAVRNGNGEYMGTLEVSQDITDIRKLEGEKRILDETHH